MEAPSAPASSAADFTRAKPGMSAARCGSMTMSSRHSLNSSRSSVKQAATKPARCADWRTWSASGTFGRSMARESRVSTRTCGWTSTARSPRGTGSRTQRSGSVETMSVSPPNREGAALSGCDTPHATRSAASAYASRDSFGRGRASSEFAATSAATAEAAEPPMPEPSAMPFRTRTSKPKPGRRSSSSLRRPTVAVFCAGSSGMAPGPSVPVVSETSETRTVGSSVNVNVTSSPAASTAKPRTSKPTATFETVAGANAAALLIAAPPGRSRAAGGPRRRRPPSPPAPRRGRARSSAARCSAPCGS